ncbi:MAG TPA: hypothetical protein VHM19_09945, partial [Polyangiales bacterium]|nr:hypothetical protein [Polyangiales bacterium]
MANAVQRFREAIEAVHAGRAEARLAWWRRAERDESWRRAADALLSEQGEEWISEAQAARVLTPEQDALCVQQRALLAAQTRQAPLAQLDARLFTTKVPCGSEALPASAILDALLTSTDANTGAVQAKALGDALGAQARERCELRSEAELTLQAFGADLQPAIAARKSAETFLRATDDAASELVPWLTHAVAPRSRAHAHALLCSLRRRELDGFAKADRRFYRLTEGLRRLGFERDLNGRVRAEPCAPGVFPSLQRWAARDVPRDVRVAGTVRDLGVLSDFDGAAAIGGGLALALVSPVLAAEERLPLAGAVPEAFAGMMLRLRADRLYLRRCEGLSARDAENVARHFAILLLLATRASAALELAAATHARNLAEREE